MSFIKRMTFDFVSEQSESLIDIVVIDFAKNFVTVQLGTSAPVEHKPISMPKAAFAAHSAKDYLNAARDGRI